MAIEIEYEFSATPEALWDILGTPDRVDWVPGVQSCSFDGEVSSLVLPGAGAIKERILKHDDETRTLEYSCFESPGGLESHHARVQIMASEVGCRLVWQASVIPASIEPFIEGSMRGCIERLEAILRS
jgi:carbon monoxide dehydrogenase subunit G